MLKSKNTLLGLLSLFLFILVLSNCKEEDEGSGSTVVPLQKIANLLVTDIGDAKNGSDLQVSFSKIADESGLEAYRIFVVNSSESTDFDMDKATTISAANYFTANKTGGDLSFSLTATSKTTTGQLIANDISYTIFVLTLTNDPNLFSSSLSSPSNAITLETAITDPGSLASITNLKLTDVGNEGNGADLQITFSKVNDEAKVKEYQIFVMESDNSSTFDLAKAQSIDEGNLFKVAKTGSNLSTTLSSDSKTINGALISNDISYTVFVRTVAEDPATIDDALSSPSAPITLNTKVKVTYIANDGVMIEFENQKVVIDGINRASNLGGWVTPSSSALMAVENGDPPFDDIDVIMITHNHGDHYSVSAVQNYLSDHPNTQLIVPNSIKPNFSAFSSQIVNFTVDKFERINILPNGIDIDVLHIEHFDQFGNDFSMVESYAYLVTMNDKKFLHTGDIDYIDSKLEVFNLLAENVTVSFIPTFGDLVSTANSKALIDHVNPENIICLHFLTSTLSTTINQVNSIYPEAEIFTTPFETVDY